MYQWIGHVIFMAITMNERNQKMKSEDLKIQGMTCRHCVMSVKKHLERLTGVTVQDVTIGSARVQYDETKVSRQDLARAIAEAGYALVNEAADQPQ